MRTTIQRWGNSLALRIPSPLAQEAEMECGAQVDLIVRRGKLLVQRSRPRYQLKALLAGVTQRNLHAESWEGPARGNEQW